MNWYIVISVLIVMGYLIHLVAIITADYDHVKNFFRYEAPAEIYAFKKEFKITTKIFDYIALILFLAIMPLTYITSRKGI